MPFATFPIPAFNEQGRIVETVCVVCLKGSTDYEPYASEWYLVEALFGGHHDQGYIPKYVEFEDGAFLVEIGRAHV